MTSYAKNFQCGRQNIKPTQSFITLPAARMKLYASCLSYYSPLTDLLIEGKHTWCRHVRFCDNLQTTYQGFLTKDCLGIDD